jgi:hypothetical protein
MRSFIITAINVSLVLYSAGIQAQEASSLVQKKLFVEWFNGKWTSEVTKDTFFVFESKPYGTGLDCNIHYSTNGVTYLEGRSLMGYDKKTDKFIQTELLPDKDIVLFATWFTKQNYCVFVHLEDISNINQASWKMELEFISPTECKAVYFLRGNPIKIEMYHRDLKDVP